MRLGYNTNGLQNHRLHDALRLLADQGYEAVAMTLDVQHLDPYVVTAREIEATAALLEKLSLHPVIETGARFVIDPTRKHEPTLMTRSAEGRERRLDFYGRCATIGADLGAEVVSFWAGIDRGDPDDAEATLLSGVSVAAELIRAAGLIPALEPEPGMAVETVADYLALCERLGAAAPALCLDVGHLYATREGSPAEVIPLVGNQIVQVHLEDMRHGEHEHILPGTGDVDFVSTRRSLEQVGYDGPVCFELSRSSHQAPDALGTCRECWANSR